MSSSQCCAIGWERGIAVKRALRTVSGSSSAQPVPHGALVGVFGQSFEPISLELRRDWVCRGAGGFRHA